MTREFIFKRYQEQNEYLNYMCSRIDLDLARKDEIIKSAYSQLFYFMDLKLDILRKESACFKHRLKQIFGGVYHYKKEDTYFHYSGFFQSKYARYSFRLKLWFQIKILDIKIIWLKIRLW